jgi:hypothetical protein
MKSAARIFSYYYPFHSSRPATILPGSSNRTKVGRTPWSAAGPLASQPLPSRQPRRSNDCRLRPAAMWGRRLFYLYASPQQGGRA